MFVGHSLFHSKSSTCLVPRPSDKAARGPSRAPVVQKLDSTYSAWIQRISIWETNCVIHWIEIHPSDSVIHLLNDWAMVAWYGRLRTKLEWTQEKRNA